MKTITIFLGVFLMTTACDLERQLSYSQQGNTMQYDFDNDFEDGQVAPWTDLSLGGTHWTIKSMTTGSWENVMSTNLPPTLPTNSNHVLRLEFDLETFDIGILSTTDLIASPGDTIQFSYCIYSQYNHFQNIELFWSPAGQQTEERLIELFTSSVTGIPTWETTTAISIPVLQPTKGRLIIYGFGSPGGVIAIDEIKFIQGSAGISSTNFDVSTALSKNTPFPTTEPQTEPSEHITPPIDIENSSIKPIEPTGTDEIRPTDHIKDLTTFEVSPTSMATFEPTPNYKSCTNKEIPPETDFTPCACTLYLNTDEPEIRCDLVNMTDVRDGIFKRLNYVYIRSLYLKLTENDSIPSNFLGSAANQINLLTFDCTNNTNPLEVSPLAFESNTSILFNHLDTISCDFSDMSFLSGEMKHVDDIKFQNSSNLHEVFATIPSEFSMSTLQIAECSNLALINNRDKLPNLLEGIQTLRLSNNKDLKDESLIVLLDWLRENSMDKLAGMYIQNNGLTQFPLNMFFFSKLQNFTFTGNRIKSGIFVKGSLEFSNILQILDLRDCGIETMEQDAILCDFSYVELRLYENRLARFDSSTFLSILEQMIYAKMLIEGNPIDCISDPCHLAWLIRDRRDLLFHVKDGKCADGRSFLNIKPTDEMFNDCP